MKQVQSSGVLMVFSQAWVEELYHQVLERNMLGEAGYWGSPEEHSLPLISMLTGQYNIMVARLTSKRVEIKLQWHAALLCYIQNSMSSCNIWCLMELSVEKEPDLAVAGT